MEKREVIDSIIENYKLLKSKRPLIHQISNYVSANIQANITLAVGGRPVMAEHPQEIRSILKQAKSLLLNLGTINEKRVDVIIDAFRIAREYNVPTVLDPVGIGASKIRRELVFRLLKEGKIDVIKGNAGEINSLCNLNSDDLAISGVDYLSRDINYFDDNAISSLSSFSSKHNVVIVITGKEDLIIDSCNLIKINNGVSILGEITGSGCMTGSLIASYLAVNINKIKAAVTGVVVMGLAGELAAKKASGPGSFRVHFFDEIANLSSNLDENVKLDIKKI